MKGVVDSLNKRRKRNSTFFALAIVAPVLLTAGGGAGQSGTESNPAAENRSNLSEAAGFELTID
jgi:hypothetical protein